MVSDDRVTIAIEIQTEVAFAEITDFEKEVDKVASKWQRVKRAIQNESTKVLYSLQGMINLAKTILNKFGVSLGAMGDALVNMVGAIITSVIALQYAYAASGPVGWVMMGVTIVALSFALDAQIKAAFGMEEAKRLSDDAVSILSSIQSTLTPWRY